MSWFRWLLFSECKTCYGLILENEILTKELEHQKRVSLTLAEKIAYRPTTAPVKPKPEEKAKPKHKRGVNWQQSRARLEDLTNQ